MMRDGGAVWWFEDTWLKLKPITMVQNDLMRYSNKELKKAREINEKEINRKENIPFVEQELMELQPYLSLDYYYE